MKLVVLGGWGMPATVLAPLCEALVQLPAIDQVQCQVLDRPLDQWREEVVAALSPDSFLLGWSLGGMLAWELAAQAPERVRGIATVASNPRFLASSDWPWAYDPLKFEVFAQDLARDPRALLNRFAALITLGSPHQREELRWLRTCLAEAEPFVPQVLAESLEALAQFDLRETLQHLEVPVLHILGARDALVPAALASHLEVSHPRHRVALIPDMAHVPSAAGRQAVVDCLQDFLETISPQRQATQRPTLGGAPS